MKTLSRWTLASVFALAVIGCVGSGCKKNPTASIYDPSAGQSGQPVVTAIVPENAPYALSGVTMLDLNGSNFSSDPSKMIVYFNAQPVPILSATPTQIRVKTPNFYKDSVNVRVSVIGVDKFSESQYINIKPSVLLADSIDFGQQEPRSIAVDRNENIYVSMTGVTGGLGLGVFKFSPAGNRQQVSLKGGEVYFYGMKVGPGDTVFAVRHGPGIFYINPNILTISQTYSVVSTPPLRTLDDLDFDIQKNLWAGGVNTTGIYRINKYHQSRGFSFPNAVHSLRVFNGAVYCAATVITATDTSEIVYKFTINPADTSLGAPEAYFNLTAQPGYQFAKITAITFDINGVLYVGTDKAGLLGVSGANAAPVALYTGVVGPSIVGFHWGTGTILYVIQANIGSSTPQTLLKVDMQVQSAPYYGRE